MMHRLALALLLAAAACSGQSAAQGTGAKAEDPVALTLVKVETARTPDLLTLTGTIAAEESSDVASSVPGRVLDVLVERGQDVKFGDPLVRLDASSAALSAQSVKAQLAAAQAQEKLAADECKRAQALLDKGAITRSQFDRETTTCTAAAQTVAATRAQLDLVSKSIRDGLVRAPFAGRVDGRWVSPGEWIQPGMRLVTLVDLDPLHVELAIPESAVPLVKVGQRVDVTAVAFGERKYAAKIRRVGAEVGRMNRALIAEAELAPGAPLTPGMFAEASITLDHDPMPVVPAQALVYRGTTWRVFAVAKGHLEERVVQRGPQLPDGRWSIKRGVAAGELVAAPITEQVVDGVAVAQ